jgi:hypothetical protein
MARRRVVVGKQYYYRLKQFAQEKFSAVSLASTNIRSENTKSKANKQHKTVHASTPVRFGEMEFENLMHSPVENIVQIIMLLSTSPLARRLHQQLLTGNPFNIDIKLDKDSKSRSVEIVNAYLKTAGLRLKFDKIPIKKVNGATRIIVTRVVGKFTKKEIVDKIPDFLSCDDLPELIAKNNKVMNKPLQIVSRVPNYIKTQEEADLYIKDKMLSEGISNLLSLVDSNIKTKEDLEKRIENPERPVKMLQVVSRRVVTRLPRNNLENAK